MSAIAQTWARVFPSAANPAGEQGGRLPSDDALQRLYSTLFIDYERRALVQLIREMDLKDGRVKSIHKKVARDVIRGGLVMQYNEKFSSETLRREWQAFHYRLNLCDAEKLKSDARGMAMEGNLPLQLVLGEARDVVAAIRMPSETMVPLVDLNGRYKDPAKAWEQRDMMTGRPVASFSAWQLCNSRLDPDNFDDLGAMGRPWLDSCVKKWRQLDMAEDDLVIRRRMRAPLRLAHVLEGADTPIMDAYRQDVENRKGDITTDYYLNRKGGVQAVQGDANMGEISDVVHLLDTFFAGSPAPKGLFGYADGLSRDILEDLKRDYYDEIDGLQDLIAESYEWAFRIHLLFKGIDPGPDEIELRFAQRRTETANQVADLALKYMALGLPTDFIYSEMGLDPQSIDALKKAQADRGDPYPQPNAIGGGGLPTKVSITPNNAPKGESATNVSQPGSNGGRGRG